MVLLLLVGLFIFILESVDIVAQTNQHNVEHSIKIRNTIEEIDKIVERAELNLNVFSDEIYLTYDTSKFKDPKYNYNYLNSMENLSKSVLLNTPGVDGSWFQLNVKLPFSPNGYIWHVYRNGKIINLKDKLTKGKTPTRIINPHDDGYYFNAIKGTKLIWSDFYLDLEENTAMITLSKPIYKNGMLIGVAGIDITKANMQNALKNMQKVFSESEVFLLNHNYDIILSQLLKTSTPKKRFDFVDDFKNIKTSELTFEFDDNNIHKTAIVLTLSNKYYILLTFPNQEIFKGYNRLFKTIYFIFSILIVLAIISLTNKLKMIKMNKQLETEMLKLRLVLDASPNVVLIKDTKGVYIDCNKKFLKIFNIKKEEIIGKTDYDLFPAEEAAEITRHDNLVFLTKTMTIKEATYSDRNGNNVYIEKYIIPFLNAQDELLGLLIIGFDITKRKQEQNFLQKAKEDAEKTTEMKSNFLANMSHEIRTPMNGVLGFIQLLKETNTSKEQSEFIEDAQKSSEILLNIINDILDFSKIEADKLRMENTSFNVRSVVEDVTIMAAATAERRGIELNSLICSDIPHTVIGDPGRVKQILNNLVNNALKFTQNGEVVIYARQIWEDSDTCVLSFKVKDTGIGIEEEKLNEIFNAFTQADASTTRKFGGTGLGLAISKKLAELMNGSLYAESSIGEGSVFTLTVPFLKDKKINKKPNKFTETLNGKKILVVDNNMTDLKILQYYLSDSNCIIYKAHTRKEALEILEKENQNISVVFIDYKLEGSGAGLSSLIKGNELLKDIPLILYCTMAKRGDSAMAKEKGFAGFLTRPIKKNELLETISMVINESNQELTENFVTKHLVKEYNFDTKAKILLVEDSEINSKLVFKILKNKGLSCDLANNGQEAIDAFLKNNYDLILMDCQMPILDGYKATQRIREAENGKTRIPIIAMTANALPKDKEKCFAAGMDEYLSKPINIDALLEAISKYITVQKPENIEIDADNSNKDISDIEEIENIINEIITELAFTKTQAIELFTQYLEYLPEAVLEIDNAMQENDFEKLERTAHKLKGSSANLRIEKLTQLSKQLQQDAKTENIEFCNTTVKEIQNHIEYLNALLLKFVHL